MDPFPSPRLPLCLAPFAHQCRVWSQARCLKAILLTAGNLDHLRTGLSYHTLCQQFLNFTKFPDEGGTWELVIFYGPLLLHIIPLHSHPKEIIDLSTVFQLLTLTHVNYMKRCLYCGIVGSKFVPPLNKRL